jgi:hypothetical protein
MLHPLLELFSFFLILKQTYYFIQVKDEAKALLVKLAKAKEPEPEPSGGTIETASGEMDISQSEEGTSTPTTSAVLQEK